MKMKTLNNSVKFQPGTRIHYEGDQANYPSDGTITKYRPADKYTPESVDIEYDETRFEGDSKVSRMVPIACFQPGPGRRFWLLTEWDEEQSKRLTRLVK